MSIDGWKIDFIDSKGDVGVSTSLAFDVLGNQTISYYDVDNYDMKYAYYNGTA